MNACSCRGGLERFLPKVTRTNTIENVKSLHSVPLEQVRGGHQNRAFALETAAAASKAIEIACLIRGCHLGGFQIGTASSVAQAIVVSKKPLV